MSWNRAAAKLYGYSEAELIGQSFLIIVPVDHESEIKALVQRIHAGESVDQLDTVRRRKDGSLITVSLTISPVCDAAGRIIGSSRIARNVTAQRRAERELTRAHDAIDDLFGTSPDVMAIIGVDGGFVRVNAAFERLLGLSAKSVAARAARAAGLEAVLIKPVGQSTLRDLLLDSLSRTPKSPHRSQVASRSAQAQAEAETVTENRGRVLVAEDNQINQIAARRVLQKLGFSVDIARDTSR